MTLRVLDGSQLSEEDVRIINSLANSAPSSPHGARTAEMMVAPRADEGSDEEEEQQSSGFDLAELEIPEGETLFDVARDNWNDRKMAMGGLFNGGFNGMGLPETVHPDMQPLPAPIPMPIPPGFEGTPVPIPTQPGPIWEPATQMAGLGGGGGFMAGLRGLFGG